MQYNIKQHLIGRRSKIAAAVMTETCILNSEASGTIALSESQVAAGKPPNVLL